MCGPQTPKLKNVSDATGTIAVMMMKMACKIIYDLISNTHPKELVPL